MANAAGIAVASCDHGRAVADRQDLEAGTFSSWAARTLAALDTEAGVDVPCGACTACCRSSYFIHIEPGETETLRRIPRALRFPAPGRPEGHVVLGYDERGHCPMLVDDRCSIYEHRPRTCRNFDCRIFPAAGLSPDDDGKALIATQAARWRFDHPTARDGVEHDAVRAATAFLRAHAEEIPDGAARATADLAMSALKAHRAFLERVDPDVDAVRTALRD